MNGVKAFSAVAPTIAAVKIADENPQRISMTIHNAGGTAAFLGNDAGVTSATGMPLMPGEKHIDRESTDAWWVVMASRSGDVRGMEISEKAPAKPKKKDAE